LGSAEQQLIESALERNHGNRQRTAHELGIDPSTLYRKLKAFALPVPPRDGRNTRNKRR
jgi:DNA-binding NtrC family response regulator